MAENFILSSSGASPLYLENVVRALALPNGEILQYRYSEKIVGKKFRELVEQGKAVGATCYLSYLDVDGARQNPIVYPVREAVVSEVLVRGTSYIIRLRLERYINWDICSDLDQHLRLTGDLQELPCREKDQSVTGYWVSQTDQLPCEWLVPHDPKNGAHLAAFEATVRHLETGSDFKVGNYLFSNILSIRDLACDNLITDQELAAPGRYGLRIYYYSNMKTPSKEFGPFEISVSSESSYVDFLSKSSRAVEAKYDELDFHFSLGKDYPSNQLGLDVCVTRSATEGTEVQVLNGYLPMKVKKSPLEPIIQFILIAGGVATAQFLTLSKLGKLDTGVAILVSLAALAAAAGSVWRIQTKP